MTQQAGAVRVGAVVPAPSVPPAAVPSQISGPGVTSSPNPLSTAGVQQHAQTLKNDAPTVEDV